MQTVNARGGIAVSVGVSDGTAGGEDVYSAVEVNRGFSVRQPVRINIVKTAGKNIRRMFDMKEIGYATKRIEVVKWNDRIRDCVNGTVKISSWNEVCGNGWEINLLSQIHPTKRLSGSDGLFAASSRRSLPSAGGSCCATQFFKIRLINVSIAIYTLRAFIIEIRDGIPSQAKRLS